MKLTRDGMRDRASWERAGVSLPSYDVAAVAEKTREKPVWVHFGIGNIFRVFIGSIAEKLVTEGAMDAGITCAETFDTELVERIYAPHDCLGLNVILHGDGRRDLSVLGCFGEAVAADGEAGRERLKQVFAAPSLQLASFTITEKGYQLRDADGQYFPWAKREMEEGPEAAASCIGVVAAMLLARFRAGKYPIALVSMDNCSQNGEKLRGAVLEMAGAWAERGLIGQDALGYMADEGAVAFPWTMIDKITPRPSLAVAEDLEKLGIEDMAPITTGKNTYIAPFANAEGPQYLVIEDSFPNGRPPLERAGVYLGSRDTVNRAERMKVTACLNPVHTALCTFDCMLGYDLFADGMKDPLLDALARRVGYAEGMAVAPDPGIFSPKAFMDELMEERFPNAFLGDTSLRIATDISQMAGIRFGETIHTWRERGMDTGALVGLPLAIAGWIRYLLALDDGGRPMELAPDPMIPKLQKDLEGLALGDPGSVGDRLRPILSNKNLFRVDLYEDGLGERVEGLVAEMLEGPGAVRRTLQRHLSEYLEN